MKHYDYHAARRTLLKPSARHSFRALERRLMAALATAADPRDAARRMVDVVNSWSFGGRGNLHERGLSFARRLYDRRTK